MNVPLHNRIEYNSFLQKISFILMTSTKIWHWKSRWKSLWEGDVGCQENKTSGNLLSHEFQTRNAVSAMTWITKFGAPNKLLCPCIFFFFFGSYWPLHLKPRIVTPLHYLFLQSKQDKPPVSKYCNSSKRYLELSYKIMPVTDGLNMDIWMYCLDNILKRHVPMVIPPST